MLRRLLKKQTTNVSPFQQRWDHFLKNDAIVPTAIALIESVPDDKLRDIDFLELELIPALGLNDENLHEQPQELSSFFGTGLHVFQYPNQLARYLAWLADHARDTRAYAEIGSRWGGTFITVCEWLHRIGAPLHAAIAIDPIGETPMLKLYGNHLAQRGVDYRFAKEFSPSPLVNDLFSNILPDFVFIDGDHSMVGALADHMLARQSAKIIVHHDIASDACPETTELWNALKKLESGTFTSIEFIDQYASVKGSFLGIGALRR